MNTWNLAKPSKLLKGLSHEIETGCRWYGCVDLYLEKCRQGLLIFQLLRRSFNSNLSSPSGLATVSGQLYQQWRPHANPFKRVSTTLLKHFKRLSTTLLQIVKGGGQPHAISPICMRLSTTFHYFPKCLHYVLKMNKKPLNK